MRTAKAIKNTIVGIMITHLQGQDFNNNVIACCDRIYQMLEEEGNLKVPHDISDKNSVIDGDISESDKPIKSVPWDEYEDTYRKTFSMQPKERAASDLKANANSEKRLFVDYSGKGYNIEY